MNEPNSLRQRITGRVLTNVPGAIRLVVSLGAREDDFEYQEEECPDVTLVIARSPRGLRVLRTMFDTRRARPIEYLARATTQRSLARVAQGA